MADHLTFPADPLDGPLTELPIGARGLIGDGHTAALIRADGAIDWLCLPRFDSPSAFAALLDPAHGGLTAVLPAGAPFKSLQRYVPDTHLLETIFTVEGQGVVQITDFMPWTDDPRASSQEIHRLIQCVEGQVQLKAIFDPRFDYGRDPTTLEWQAHGLLAQGARGELLTAALGSRPRWSARSAGGAEATLSLNAGQREWMVIAWGQPEVASIAAHRSEAHLQATQQAWRAWADQVTYEGPWRSLVVRSALVLKLLIYAPTGALVAAPTTSLPEWIGGTRNWDYRFNWARDASLAIKAITRVGGLPEARAFFQFIQTIAPPGQTLPLMTTVEGEPVPEEATLPHLSGAYRSGPVRIGNGARDQIQLDIYGAVVDAAEAYEQAGGRLSLAEWRSIKPIIEQAERRWREPDHGIWEPRTGLRHNLHSRLMCQVALARGASLAARFGDETTAQRWRQVAEAIRADLCAHGLDPTGVWFTNAFGETEPDAAALLLPILGVLPPDDPRVFATVDQIQAALGAGPFVYRYRHARMDDGVGGAEGAFVLCGFWLAEALALAGRLDEAQRVFAAHAACAHPLGLLAEEIDPDTGALLGNFPQAFSHLGLINAACAIQEALRASPAPPPAPSSAPPTPPGPPGSE